MKILPDWHCHGTHIGQEQGNATQDKEKECGNDLKDLLLTLNEKEKRTQERDC